MVHHSFPVEKEPIEKDGLFGRLFAFYDPLREQGAEVAPLVDQGSCGLQFTFKDPDGNKFNVWQDAV